MTAEQAFQPRTYRTKDAEIPGRGMMRFRELKQREREAIEANTMKQEEDEKGKIKVRRDEIGTHALAVAFSAIKADGSPLFSDPYKAAETINDLWTWPEVNAAFKVVDELSILSLGAQRAAGKGSGGAGGDDS
jgi:hypothetical protein